MNIALIGTWGRGAAHFDAISTENVVALCDVNEEHLPGSVKRFPNAKRGPRLDLGPGWEPHWTYAGVMNPAGGKGR